MGRLDQAADDVGLGAQGLAGGGAGADRRVVPAITCPQLGVERSAISTETARCGILEQADARPPHRHARPVPARRLRHARRPDADRADRGGRPPDRFRPRVLQLAQVRGEPAAAAQHSCPDRVRQPRHLRGGRTSDDRRRGPRVHPQAVSPRPRVARLQPAAVRARTGGARRVHGARAPRARAS